MITCMSVELYTHETGMEFHNIRTLIVCTLVSQWPSIPSGCCVQCRHVLIPLPLCFGPLVQLINCCSHREGLGHTVTHSQCQAKVLLLVLEGEVGLKVTSQHGCKGRGMHTAVSELLSASCVLMLPITIASWMPSAPDLYSLQTHCTSMPSVLTVCWVLYCTLQLCTLLHHLCAYYG